MTRYSLSSLSRSNIIFYPHSRATFPMPTGQSSFQA
nr:MAG TPA: hypothetical protein [Caudoviricetes sp.]